MHLFKKKYNQTDYFISLCCIQKDENPYLPEWIDYHRKIGVDHFYIYDNNSKVSPGETLQPLVQQKIVTIIDFPGSGMQLPAYNDCLTKYGNQSTWLGFIDVDEFIVPLQPKGDLPVFLRQFLNYGGVGVSWLIFGSNGHKVKSSDKQIERFLLRSKPDFSPNRLIKSIVQPEYTMRAGDAHSFLYKKKKFCVNENFEKIEGPFSKNSTKKIQLNHYYCRSLEEYHQKIERGFANKDLPRRLSQFFHHDIPSNEIEDKNALEILNNPVYK